MFQPHHHGRSGRLDLYNLVTHHPDATFFVKYEGSDLEDFGILKNDILIIDRSIQAKKGKLAVVIADEEFQIVKIKNAKELVGEHSEIELWGVITFIIHKT